MTRMEQLEKQEAELYAKQKMVKKELAMQRRKAKAKAEAEALAREQAEAMEFVRFCRGRIIKAAGEEMTLYECILKMMEIDHAAES